MDVELVSAEIERVTGRKATIVASTPCTGGSINQTHCVSLADNRRYFVKTHPHAEQYPGMYDAEHRGLERLSQAGAIRVPQPLCATEQFIVMEYLEMQSRTGDWQELMGRQLAAMHKTTAQVQYGFDHDNYLGSSLQHNREHADWVSFWRNCRLEPQLRRIRSRYAPENTLVRLGDALSGSLESIIGEPLEPAVLIHGDLWSGNCAADNNGQPVIFDPACYYARREAEIGMMMMFGGFDARCFAAYSEFWPLESDGYARRIAVYRLYHEMNHLLLFGDAYYTSSVATLQEILGSKN